jgi:hypothetical protein
MVLCRLWVMGFDVMPERCVFGFLLASPICNLQWNEDGQSNDVEHHQERQGVRVVRVEKENGTGRTCAKPRLNWMKWQRLNAVAKMRVAHSKAKPFRFGQGLFGASNTVEARS